MGSRYDATFWKKQHLMDPEKGAHKDVRLFWVWNEKAEFLWRTVGSNPFQSTFFAWVDIGYFRTSKGFEKFNHCLVGFVWCLLLYPVTDAWYQNNIVQVRDRCFHRRSQHVFGGPGDNTTFSPAINNVGTSIFASTNVAVISQLRSRLR